MRQDNKISITPLVTLRKLSIRFRKFPNQSIHNQHMSFNVRAKPKPSSYIICTNNSSISVLTTDPNNNKTIVQITANNGTTSKKETVCTNKQIK